MSKTRAPSDLQDHLGFWLRFVSNQVSSRFAQQVESAGVSVSEWVALRTLFAVEAASPSSLIASLGMTKGAVSKIVDRLVEKRLAKRLSDPEDARAQRVALTHAGRALVPKLAALADSNDALFFGRLSARDRAALQRILRDLVQLHGLTEVPTQ